MAVGGSTTGTRRTHELRVVRRPDDPTSVSKRSLVAISHAIESAVLGTENQEPTVVVALFQRLAYFEREYAVYERLARAGVVCIVAFTDGEQHQLPDGVDVVLLDPDEPLADEWSTVAVGPEAGAFLVATDTHQIDPTEYTLEAGREFSGRWGYSRVQAANELARLRIALGRRLDPATAGIVDDLLARVMPPGGATAASRGTTGEQWATASLQRMTAKMDDVRAGSRLLRAQLVDAHAAADARTTARLDPESGLPTPEFLDRWAGTDGRVSALPVGIAVFEFDALRDARAHHSRRSVYHAARQVAAALTEPLGPVDAAVRLSEATFAVIVPGASAVHLQRMAAAICEQLEMYSSGLPGPSLDARVATAVTLSRPLPFDDLHLALGHPSHADETPTTLAGDEIVVAASSTLASAATAALPEPPDERADDRAGGRWFRDQGAAPATTRMPRVRVPATPRVEDTADTGAGVGAEDGNGTGSDRSATTSDVPVLRPRGRHGGGDLDGRDPERPQPLPRTAVGGGTAGPPEPSY